MNRDKVDQQAASARLASYVAVPVVIAGVACVAPLLVAAFGASRLARGQVQNLGTDTISAGRSMWRATSAAVAALTGRVSRDG